MFGRGVRGRGRGARKRSSAVAVGERVVQRGQPVEIAKFEKTKDVWAPFFMYCKELAFEAGVSAKAMTTRAEADNECSKKRDIENTSMMQEFWTCWKTRSVWRVVKLQ
eukprot:gene5148-5798_t